MRQRQTGSEEWHPKEKEEQYESSGKERVLCEGLGEVGGNQCRHCSLLHTGPTCTSGDPACERREERKREGGECE